MLEAQRGIQFYKMELDKALDMAQRQNKSVFVDVYAKWCIPCKKMDKTFRDIDLGEVFNNNFINVRIDMDLPSSQTMKEKYEIIFLPTLMILDPQGRVRYKTDKVLEKEELLEIANLTADPNVYFESEATKIFSSPVVGVGDNNERESKVPVNPTAHVTSADIASDKGEKILYVLDGENTDVPPDVLYQEAYFRLQKMNGTQYRAAEEYLASQKDWTTEKNIRFIFDFLYDTKSPMFDFFINNEDIFGQYYDPQQLRISREKIIYQRLYQGIPRPDFSEIKTLFSYLDHEKGEKNAYHFYFNRLREDKNTKDYQDLATIYFENHPDDLSALYKYIRYLLLEKKLTAGNGRKYMNEANRLANSSSDEHQLLAAHIYLITGKRELALTTIDKAMKSIQPDTKKYDQAQKLKNRILQL